MNIPDSHTATADLADGDRFTLDGTTWHTVAVNMSWGGTVSVYATARRGATAPTVRVDVTGRPTVQTRPGRERATYVYTDNSGQPYVEADDGTLRLVSICHEAPFTIAPHTAKCFSHAMAYRGPDLSACICEGPRFRCSVCSTPHDYYGDLTPDITEREHRANANAAD